MLNLPDTFKEKYRALLGEATFPKFIEALNEEPKKGFRLNTLKNQQNISYPTNKKVPNIPNAYYGAINGNDSEWVSGSVYSQDPAAMFPAFIAKAKPFDKVLDLCAAPGGKTTYLAESLKNQGLLVANEISANRVKILRENLERWGVSNALITNNDSYDLAKNFPDFFDLILVDAPCSGEGMFRKKPDAISYWSQDYVLTCQTRQKEILTNAVKMLAPGGKLVYATCTFAPEEDEAIVDWLCQEFNLSIIEPTLTDTKQISHGQAKYINSDNLNLNHTLRFWPQDDLGEGQFAAILVKNKQEEVVNQPKKKTKKKRNPLLLKDDQKELVAKVLNDFNLPPELKDWDKKTLVRNDHVFIPAYNGKLKDIKIVNNGLELGVLKKKRFEPGHHLAEVLGQVKQEKVIELNSNEEFKKYLHGETLRTKSSLRNFVLVSYHNLIFSFAKVTGNGVVKNFYPKGLRQ